MHRGNGRHRAFLPILAIVLLLLQAAPAMADTGWPHRAGGSGGDSAAAMARDADGSLLVAGQFSGTASFGSFTLTSSGGSDIYVGKMSPGGSWLWVTRGGGTSDDGARAVAVDADGGVYIAGYYRSSNARLGNAFLPYQGGAEAFVAKLDSTGNWVWRRAATGTGDDMALAVAVNEDGEVFAAGSFTGTLSLTGTSQTLGVQAKRLPVNDCPVGWGGPYDWSCCYYNGPCELMEGDCDSNSQCKNGLVCWQRSGSTSADEFDVCVWPTGVDFQDTDMFVAKLNQGGEWQWGRAGGGQFTPYPILSSLDSATGLAVITDNSNPTQPRNIIYVAGTFQQELQLYNGATPFPALPLSAPQGRRDVFVAKLEELGESWLPDMGGGGPAVNPYWTWVIDSRNNTAADELWANGLTMDSEGNLYVTGGYRGTPGLTTAANLTASPTASSAFVARVFDNGASGTWEWSRDAGFNASHPAEAFAVAADDMPVGQRGVYLAGSFRSQLNVRDELGTVETVQGNNSIATDVFVARFRANDGQLDWVRRGGLFDAEAPGAIVSDESGTTFVAGGFSTVTSMIDGAAMRFNGVDQFVLDPANVSETNYAVSLWFRTEDPDAGIFCVTDRTNPSQGGGHDRHLYLTGGNLATRVWKTGGGEVIRTNGSNFADGEWHHVVHTLGGVAGGQKLYVDGIERASGTLTDSDFTWQTGLFLGFSWDALHDYLNGTIARFQVLPAAVGPSEVMALYAQRPVPSSGKLLFSAGAEDIFVASLTVAGRWRESELWTVGQAVPFPDGAVALKPDYVSPSDGDNYFYWSESERKLYSTWPVGALIKWKVSTDETNTSRITSVGSSSWPERPQVHVAGVPVELQPAGTSYYYTGIQRTGNGATTTEGNVLNITSEGYTVLRYGNGGYDLTAYPVAFEVVRTLYWDDPEIFTDGRPAVIGRRITDNTHNDPQGKNGFVYFSKAYYDGAGNRAAYDRASRSGPIIPVNRYRGPAAVRSTPQETGKDMVVVWYETNLKNIAWPVKPVRYACYWPAAPMKIIIASELGSDVLGQPPLDPLAYPQAHVYRQNDDTLPGYNPNEEHAALFPSATGNGYDAVFALRDDLYNPLTGLPSEPYVLLKYLDPADNRWSMLVYRVLATDGEYTDFQYQGTAGTPIFPPYPVRLLNPCEQSWGQNEPWWQDSVNGQYWARSAGTVTARYHYPLLIGFDYATNPSGIENFDGEPGECVGWLDRRTGSGGLPVPVTYNITWPPDVPVLQVGETLVDSKRGLPNIVNQATVEVVFDELDPDSTDPAVGLVQIIQPLEPRSVVLADGNGGWVDLPPELATRNVSGKLQFTGLPFHLGRRLYFNPQTRELSFKGYYDDTVMGDPLLLLNVMTGAEEDEILALIDDQHTKEDDAFRDAVEALFYKTRNPRGLDLYAGGSRDGRADEIASGQPTLIGLQDADDDGVAEPLRGKGGGYALTAGGATGTGFVTLAFNNDPSLGGLPVSLEVIRVDCGPYLGEIKVIEPENVFDEKLTLRHSGDFGGNPENFEFEWYYHPDEDGTSPSPPPSPDTQELNGWLPFASGAGLVDITIRGASIQTMSDNWFYVRYKGYDICGDDFTTWAGAPGSTALNPTAQLAEGWVKRVVRSLNAFEARVKDFHAAPTATYVSMIRQAGERYEGDVAMNNDPDNLNSMGLIEAYETVLRRGIDLSIGGTPPIDYAPANAALLLAASRISDLYMLLGNEAYSDAADPTIGFTTQGGVYGNAAPSIFAFQNQLDSLLEEELTLLRGRDYAAARPVYNRLVWNFTSGEGEVAYSQVYGLNDQNGDGFIDEYDARILYPQGHGDAWGHYLTAMTVYYDLLRHPYYSWDPRPEAVLVGGAPVQVDYLDERKFAKGAAAKAKAGAEIVDLTYRLGYVADPAGQWQGYKDTSAGRAWGLAEWGRRAGQGAYFDWVTGNAVLPAVDPDPTHTGIRKIDRTTVRELAEVASQYTAVQAKLDNADAGLNPLGLAKGAVAFDIDPVEVSAGRTHFEQIHERARAALGNAVDLFNHANRQSQMLRLNQDSLEDFVSNVNDAELDYKNRLIEIFGYPYSGDMGPAGTYPSDYDGPDVYHYMWVDSSQLMGNSASSPEDVTVTLTFADVNLDRDDDDQDPFPDDDNTLSGYPPANPMSQDVTYRFSVEGLGIVKPQEITGQRRAPGEVQRAISDLLRARASYEQSLMAYDTIIGDIQRASEDLSANTDFQADKIEVLNDKRDEQMSLTAAIGVLVSVQRVLRRVSATVEKSLDKAGDCLPTTNGFSNDFTSAIRCAIKLPGIFSWAAIETIADALNIISDGLALAKEDVELEAEIELERLGNAYERDNMFAVLEALIRQEPAARLDAFQRKDELLQAVGRYYSVLAEGERLASELETFRRNTAARIQEYRYQDMAFRVFRNEALQKYRAQFDLAARYTYLAATAYDYETNLLATSSASGQRFLTDIVRQRSLGLVTNDGRPVAGVAGLADPLARLSLNFNVLKGQLGFNNPQTETNRFSLRSELFRIIPDDPAWPAPPVNSEGAEAWELWSDALESHRVDDLWAVPEFRRHCRPFTVEEAGPQPGLVIPFATTVNFGLNYFGWPLGGGDSSYDPTNFATKIRSVGVWFGDYDLAGLSNTPRVYLVPAGVDIMRSPSAVHSEVRSWSVIDQKLPVPFPVGSSDLTNPEWIPLTDSLSDELGGVRRFSSFRAYHDQGDFDPAETVADSRLIGRSVWNTKWLLIIPGGTLHFDPDVGLDRFVSHVTDIKVFFQTYGYSGN